uniref:Uncharacterized protein n=1 Tax=Sphaerodactylus townsendi TaxID=933632 RepID=A0ACB8FTP8_9SAUR
MGSEQTFAWRLVVVPSGTSRVAEEWHTMGGENWQLIEPVDGFHPTQIASVLMTKVFWEKILHKWPHILGKGNPHNNQIAAVFKDQGGH